MTMQLKHKIVTLSVMPLIVSVLFICVLVFAQSRKLEEEQARLVESSIMAAKKAGVRIYPTNEAFAQALKTEEIGVGIMWKARVVQWQNAGISVEAVAPSEDVVPAGAAAVVAQPVRRRADAAARANAVRMRGTEVSWER